MRDKYNEDLFGKRRGEELYYEDTHDAKGNFVGSYPYEKNNKPNQGKYTAAQQAKSYYEPPKQMPQQQILFDNKTDKNVTKNPFSTRSYNNVVVYEPRTPSDVQALIDYLKRKEPAIINLDTVEEETAQRILDFLSGAVYALGGSIHRISSNIFLLTPEGVVITAPI